MKKITLIISLVTIFQLYSKAQQMQPFVTADQSTSFKFSSLEEIIPNKKNVHVLFYEKDYNYYMHKRNNNKKIGWILLGSGFGFTGLGALLASTNNAANSQGPTAAICILAGAATGIASIPFMIMANVNKHKARAILEEKKTGYGIPSGNKTITGITFCISLGK